MKRIQIGWFGIAAIAVAGLTGCGSPAPKDLTTSGGSAQAIAVPPAPVSPARRDIIGYALLTGQLYWPAEEQANITVPNGGAVDTILTPVGTRVRKGQVLIKLQSSPTSLDTSSASSAVTAADSAYKAAEIQYGEPVRQAKEQLDAAQQAEREARTGSDDTAVENATQARRAAETALQQARSDELSNLAQYRLQRDQARAAAKDTASATRQGEVIAPISGTLLSLNATVGTPLGGANATIGHIVNLQSVQIKATFSDDYAKVVRTGAAVVITFSDIPNRIFDGRISRIRTEPNSQGRTENMATVSFSNADGVVKPTSQIQRVGIRIGSAKNVLTVPAKALNRDSAGRTTVTTDRGDVMEVKPGLSDGEYVEIKSGLTDDVKVRLNP